MATARKLPSGSWRVRVFIGRDGSGKPIYKSVTGRSKKEAERMAARLTPLSSRVEDLSIDQAVSRYIFAKENVLSPSTITGYRTIQRNYLGSLAFRPLLRITNEDIQRHLNELALSHSPKTLENVRNFLSGVLKLYHPDFHLRVKLPAKKKDGSPCPYR